MVQQQEPTIEQAGADQQWNTIQRRIPFEVWMRSTGLPVYTGYAFEDPCAVELGEWQERGLSAAFLQLEGVRSVSELRVNGLSAGQTSEPWKTDVNELIYVLDGAGQAAVWTTGGHRRTFSWRKHSLFTLPRNCWNQLSNTGSEPARFLSYSHLPMVLSAIPDVGFHFRSPAEEPKQIEAEDLFTSVTPVRDESTGEVTWQANTVADVNAWGRFESQPGRGAQNRVARAEITSGDMSWHLSEFGPGLYKKASKFGPARLVIVTKGEGFSTMWFKAGIGVSNTRFRADLPPLDEGGRTVCNWKEGSVFSPPDNWYSQHFNLGTEPARYLALHPLPQFTGSSYAHQIEYPDEDPWFRERFESELAGRGRQSQMPAGAYTNADYQWDPAQ